MEFNLKLFALFIALLLSFSTTAQARLTAYTYPYDISEIEWQILNWTAAWRGTTTPAEPFILERMEYDRKEKKANIYLTGRPEQASDDNLNKTITGITSLFHQRFPNFEPESDLIVHYNLKSEKGEKTLYIEYNQGAFSKQEPVSNEPAKTQSTSY